MDPSLYFSFRSPQTLLVIQTGHRSDDLATPGSSSGHVSPHPSEFLRPRKRLIDLLIFARMEPFPAYPNFKSIAEFELATGVWCESQPELITGRVKKWAQAVKVEAVRVPGYWYNSPQSQIAAGARAKPNEKVFYHLHGGAYVMASASPLYGATSPMAIGLLEKTRTVNRFFSLEYRLTSSAPFPVGNPFPTALIDAVTGYSYLIFKLGFEPNNIIVVGDSSGGHLALCLIRYLLETSVLPVPGAFIGHSPLCDLTSSHLAIRGSSLEFESDILGRLDEGCLQWSWMTFAGPLHDDPIDGPTKNPYLSPACLSSEMESAISFNGFPDTFLISGGAERMRDDVRTLKLRLVRDLGEEKVESYEPPDATHAFLLFRWHEPERAEGFKLISHWVDQR